MPSRLLLVAAVLASGCGPALTMRRLSAPKAALGTARTVYVQVTPATNDTVAGEAEPVSQLVRRRVSERLAALGYATCPELPCGDGVLSVVIEEATFGGPPQMPHLPTFDMMDAAVRAVRGGKPASAGTTTTVTVIEQVDGVLRLRLAFEQTPGAVVYALSALQRVSRVATPGEVMKEAVEAAVKHLDDDLGRQSPLVMVQLEGGGPLNPGVELLHAADWKGAAAHFSELTRTRPELDGAWYDLGFAYEAQSAWVPALEAYQQAAARAKKPHYEKAVRDVQALLSRH